MMQDSNIIPFMVDQSQYEYFPLCSKDGWNLLMENTELVVDKVNEIGHIVCQGQPRFLKSCLFFPGQLSLLLPILRAWPGYMPYAELLVRTGILHQPEAEVRQIVARAHGQGDLDVLLAPLRQKLLTCQQELKFLGLQLGSVQSMGVILLSCETMHS